VQVQTNQILICGGDNVTTTGNPPPGKKCQAYDGQGIQDSGTMSAVRGDVKCAAVDGQVVMAGGVMDGTTGKSVDLWKTGGIIPALPGTLTSPLTRHAMAAANHKVVITGGYATADQTKPLSTGFLVDPAQGTVNPLNGTDSGMAFKRAWHQMVSFDDGTIMVIGGKPENATDKVGVEMFVVPD